MEKERRHFSIFWPILLITVGIVLFLNNIGTISGGTWEVIWNLWPLLFIVGGIDGLVNRSGFAGPMVGIGLGTIFLLGNFGYLPVPALDVLIEEARMLQEAGVHELNLIAQDTTDYGHDLGMKDGLATLLERLTDEVRDAVPAALREVVRWVAQGRRGS